MFNSSGKRGDAKVNIDKNIISLIEQEIENLKMQNAEMRQQVEQEIHRNELHIIALE